MPRLLYKETEKRAKKQKVKLERTRKQGKRYELTNKPNGVWFRYNNLKQVHSALDRWNDLMADIVFVK
jgi:hypothetical protein